MAFATITVTQPFLGAPLQFQPALGSQEFGELLDAFVTGSASKQEKLSEITIDFYNNATVDLNTGALVKTYYVYSPPSSFSASPWAFAQSPAQSQSSGVSPSIYTPSPASSAANLADSGYGSFSALTPPNRSRSGAASGSGRVAKKAKKDTKKVAEMRLPGFSIMTKDGVDVTNSAGRGTKTKEQREHAHLMRLMKACEDCKRKKVKCDPSHRRSHDNTIRDSNSTSNNSGSCSSSTLAMKSPYSGSPAHCTPPPPPSTLWENANASFYDLPITGNAMDDFVLFPDETTSWNTQAGQLEDYDLTHFNFDISNAGGLDDPSFLSVNPSFSLDEAHSFSPIHQYTRAAHSLQTHDQYDYSQRDEFQDWLPGGQGQQLPSISSQDSLRPTSSGSMSDGQTIPATNVEVGFTDSFSRGTLLDRTSPGNRSFTRQSPSSPSSADWSPLVRSIISVNGTPPHDSLVLSSPLTNRHRLLIGDEHFGSGIDLTSSRHSTGQTMQLSARPENSSTVLQHSGGNLGYLDDRERSPWTQLCQSPAHNSSAVNDFSHEKPETALSVATQWRAESDELTSQQLGVLQIYDQARSLTTFGVSPSVILENVAAIQSGPCNRRAPTLTDPSDGLPGETKGRLVLTQSSSSHGSEPRSIDQAGSASQVEWQQRTTDRSGPRLIPSTMSRAEIHAIMEYQADVIPETPSTKSRAISQNSRGDASLQLSVARTRLHYKEAIGQHSDRLPIDFSPAHRPNMIPTGGRTTKQSALIESKLRQPFHKPTSTILSFMSPLALCLLAGCLGGLMIVLVISSYQQSLSVTYQQKNTHESWQSSAISSSLINICRLASAALFTAHAPSIFKKIASHWDNVSKMWSCSSMMSFCVHESEEDTYKGFESVVTRRGKPYTFSLPSRQDTVT